MEYPDSDQIATADINTIVDLYFYLPEPQSREEEAIYDAVCARIVQYVGPDSHIARSLAEKAQQIIDSGEQGRSLIREKQHGLSNA